MYLITQINSVARLDDYIQLTEDMDHKYKDAKLEINMSMILCLKKIRSLEIVHFSRCDADGAAFKILDRMLNCPSSKCWALLGSEAAGLIQYWLDALRKHLISHHANWWTFLKKLLGFMKRLTSKDSKLGTLLVQETSEGMLELATNGKLDVYQRFEVLHTFNMYCADCTREARLMLGPKLERYFVRLSTLISSCGHLPAQLASLETLLRWLLPRHAPAVRRDAAARWFPPHLYPRAAVDFFLNRAWMNFYKDSRAFLNIHNESNDLVTSVVLRKLSVGDMVVLSGEEHRQTWLDVNSSSQSMSVIFEPSFLGALSFGEFHSYEALLIPNDLIEQVTLYSEASEVRLSLEALSPPRLTPLNRTISRASRVAATLSSRDLPRLDRALRAAFTHKYQVLLDVNNVPESPERSEDIIRYSGEDSTRFSHAPANERPRTLPGQIKFKKLTAQSPSSVSTASLVQLHERLNNISYQEYTKEYDKVGSSPKLSVVSEQTECFEDSGVIFYKHRKEKNFQSDNEIIIRKGKVPTDKNKENNADLNNTKRGPQSAKCVKSANEVGFLFSETLRSINDPSIISSIEQLKITNILNNTDILNNLRVQGTLQPKPDEGKGSTDNDIITEDGRKSQKQILLDCETIEDTQYTGAVSVTKTKASIFSKVATTQKEKVVKKSSSDESNTEAIIDTPKRVIDNFRDTLNDINKASKSATGEKNERNFSETCAKNQNIINSRAKKINESSTESSNDFILTSNNCEQNKKHTTDLGVDECLNDIVNNVCSDFEKYTKFCHNQDVERDILYMANKKRTSQKSYREEKDTSTEETANKTTTKPKRNPTIKLKFSKNKTKSKTMGKRKLELEPVAKMSIIPESNNESDGNKTSENAPTETDKKTPIARKKRKLYSPKDDQIQFEKSNNDVSSGMLHPTLTDDDEIVLAKYKTGKLATPKSSYREIENERKYPKNTQAQKTKKPKSVQQQIDDELEKDEHDNATALAEYKKNTIGTPKSSLTYREIEKERKYQMRVRAQKSKKTKCPLSPKTKRLDEEFEKLKEDIEVHANENLILVDKKSEKDFAIYNFSSDSEDEDYKKKRLVVQKKTSTTTIGSETSTTRRGRTTRKVKYADSKGSESENEKPVKRKKTITRRKASKSKSAKSHETKVDHPINLEDERMREAAPETLNTSFVTGNIDNNDKELVPIIEPAKQELIPEENPSKDVGTFKQKIKNTKKKVDKAIKNKESAKKNYDEKKIVARQKKACISDKEGESKDDDRTISPLPGLVVETEEHSNKLDETITTNFLQNLKNVYIEGPGTHNETIATQNMLSDNEKATSPHMNNAADELNQTFTSNKINVKQNSDTDIIDNTMNSSHGSDIERPKNKKRNRLTLKKTKFDTLNIEDSVKEKSAKITKVKTEMQKVLNNSQKSENKTRLHSKINYDEIICIDTEDVPRPGVPTRSISKETDIINIKSGSEAKSDRSIATDGITGHGYDSELPPSPELLGKKVSPREIEDMDSFTKAYNIELTRKVMNIRDSTESQTKVKEKYKKRKARTIQKSIEKDAASDVQSVNNDLNQLKRKPFAEQDYELTRLLPSRRETSSNSSPASQKPSPKSQKSPIVSIARLSLRDISKLLSSTTVRSTPKSSFKSPHQTEEIPSRSHKNKNIVIEEKSSFDNSPRVTKRQRKSQISPIKLNDFLAETMPDLEFVSKLNSISKKYFSLKTEESNHDSSVKISQESSATALTKKISLGDAKRRKIEEDCRIQTRSKSDSTQCSEKCPTAQSVNVKESLNRSSKIATVAISDSCQTSTVEDWLTNKSNAVDSADASSEFIRNIIERIDTTLVEIQQNTTKEFIGLFVEARKRLYLMEEQSRRDYEALAKRQAEFMSWMHEHAGKVLERDCRVKQGLVVLLREDAVAAQRHIAARRN